MKNETRNYHVGDARRLAVLSDHAYADAATAIAAAVEIGADDARFVEVDNTECLIAKFDEDVFIAFRGMEPTTFADLVTFSRLKLVERDGVDGPVHAGFSDGVLGILVDVMSAIVELMGDDGFLYIGGHSKGGSEAIIFAAMIEKLKLEKMRIAAVHVFGCPAVGGDEFAANYHSRLGRVTFRHVYRSDLVARSPVLLRLFGIYRHVGIRVYHYGDGSRSFNVLPVRFLIDGIRAISRRLWLVDHSTENYIRGAGK